MNRRLALRKVRIYCRRQEEPAIFNNLQVVIKHALHVCSKQWFGLPLRMNGMHRTQWSQAFEPSITRNIITHVSAVLVLKFNHIFNYTNQLRWDWTSLYDQHSNSIMVCAHQTRVRKSTLKTWNRDLFCNSAMELILIILKMASGYPLATFLHERCTGNWSRTM